MSVEIIQFNITEPDKKLCLTNSQWAQVLSVGTSWNHIRIGMRYSSTGANYNLDTQRARFGMMCNPNAGLTNGPLGLSTSHFVGVMKVNTAAWDGINKHTLTMQCGKRTSGTDTMGAAFATNASYLCNDQTWGQTAYIIEITKGAPNFTIGHVHESTTAGFVSIENLSDLVSVMNEATLANCATALNTIIGGSGTRYQSATQTLAVSEATDGFLNALVMAWPYLDCQLQISEILFRVLA